MQWLGVALTLTSIYMVSGRNSDDQSEVTLPPSFQFNNELDNQLSELTPETVSNSETSSSKP